MSHSNKSRARDEKLAAKLRENLKRRKAQMRQRAENARDVSERRDPDKQGETDRT